MPKINWYPGHMAKTRRLLQDQLRAVDAVIELCDARAPLATRNPDLARLTQGKARILILNKADLADDAQTARWLEHFRREGLTALRFNSNGGKIKDIMTGYRAFNYQFVKTFPVLSHGFEIETEMSIHAIDKRMQVENVIIPYRDRPEGSVSKLNTFSDGWSVIKTLIRLFRIYNPFAFFGTISAVLLLVAFTLFIPVLVTYFETGLVPRYPTLIVSGFLAVAAIQLTGVGISLQNMLHKNRQDFELELYHAEVQKRQEER